MCSVTVACECFYHTQMQPERKPATRKFVRNTIGCKKYFKVEKFNFWFLFYSFIVFFPVLSTQFVLQRFFHILFVLILISMFKYTTIYKRDNCLFCTKFQVSSLWICWILGIGLELTYNYAGSFLEQRLVIEPTEATSRNVLQCKWSPLHQPPFQASPSPLLRIQMWRNKAVWKYSLQHNRLFSITTPNHNSQYNWR